MKIITGSVVPLLDITSSWTTRTNAFNMYVSTYIIFPIRKFNYLLAQRPQMQCAMFSLLTEVTTVVYSISIVQLDYLTITKVHTLEKTVGKWPSSRKCSSLAQGGRSSRLFINLFSSFPTSAHEVTLHYLTVDIKKYNIVYINLYKLLHLV